MDPSTTSDEDISQTLSPPPSYAEQFEKPVTPPSALPSAPQPPSPPPPPLNPSASPALGLPWSLEKLIRRQAGALFLFLPKGTVITAEEGKRQWQLDRDSRRVKGPDGTETSELRFAADPKQSWVLTYDYSSGGLAFLPVSSGNPTKIVGPVEEPLKDPVVFLPEDFVTPFERKTTQSHRNMVRLLWAHAPSDVRKDLAAEEQARQRQLQLPHVQAPFLLWLLGTTTMEKVLEKAGVVSPLGAAGAVACMQAEQSVSMKRNRRLHIVISPASATTGHVRLCLAYEPGAAALREFGQEYRELPGGEAGQACPVSSVFTSFSQAPARFETDKLIVTFQPAVAGSTAWQLLQEPGIVQEATLQAIWAALPEPTRTALEVMVDGDVEMTRKAAKRFHRGMETAIVRDRERLEKYYELLQSALARWSNRSLFARLVDGVVDRANLKLENALLRAFRHYVARLSRMLKFSDDDYLDLVEKLNETQPL